MFSSGQLLFAGIFFVGFVIAMLYAYRKDKGLHNKYYKGSSWVLLGFLIFIALLFVIKITMKH